MIQHIVAKWYHMLHNPLILLILFQSLRTVIFTAFITLIITSSFHSPILLFSVLSAVLQYSLLQCLSPCLIFFYSAESSVSGFSVILLLSLLITYMWMGFHTKLSSGTNTTVVSCCACFYAVKTAFIETDNPFVSPLSCQKNVVLPVSFCL